MHQNISRREERSDEDQMHLQVYVDLDVHDYDPPELPAQPAAGSVGHEVRSASEKSTIRIEDAMDKWRG